MSGVPGSEFKVMFENEPRCSEGRTIPMSLNDELAVWPDGRRADCELRAGRARWESRTTRPALAIRVADVEHAEDLLEFLGRTVQVMDKWTRAGACPDPELDPGNVSRKLQKYIIYNDEHSRQYLLATTKGQTLRRE